MLDKKQKKGFIDDLIPLEAENSFEEFRSLIYTAQAKRTIAESRGSTKESNVVVFDSVVTDDQTGSLQLHYDGSELPSYIRFEPDKTRDRIAALTFEATLDGSGDELNIKASEVDTAVIKAALKSIKETGE